MRDFILRRLLHMIPTMILVSIFVFLVIQAPPGDFLTLYRGRLLEAQDQNAPMVIQQLEQRYGLGQPIYVQYWRWITGIILRGDLGESMTHNRPVAELIGERAALTALISLGTLLFTWGVAIPIGVFSAKHQYSLADHTFTFIGFIGLAVPNFLFALLLLFGAVFWFGATSVGGLFSEFYMTQPWSLAKVWDLLKHMWVPVVIIGTSGTAGSIRIMRGNLLDVLDQEYVKVAQSKGITDRRVTWNHAVRIAVNPFITGLGMWLPNIISGEVITAIVLNLPTAGPLLYNALMEQDMYLAGSFLLILAGLLLIGNLISDILLAWVDPRIRFE